jgi:hypothetical protein
MKKIALVGLLIGLSSPVLAASTPPPGCHAPGFIDKFFTKNGNNILWICTQPAHYQDTRPPCFPGIGGAPVQPGFSCKPYSDY